MMKDIKKSVAQDCTEKCQSTQHGDHISATITSREISDGDLCSYIKYVCERCESVLDTVGRTGLHIAASCGKTDLVRWLIECREADINIRDKESGYTALHRSIFYGNIHTTVELVKLGANTEVQDYDGLTYLDHTVLDRYTPESASKSGEIFTWGLNSNNSLGSQHARETPELMNVFHKEHPNEQVKIFLVNNFHSVILTESGTAYSCGHGHGGRLGLGSKHTELVPRQLKFESSSNVPDGEGIHIKTCSIARDHSLYLTISGMLFSCGLNKHRVLGIKPPPENILTPKPLRFLNDHFVSVATGDYHSLAWTKTGLFTWGLNAGQLGHHLNNPTDDKYVLTPKKVKSIDFDTNNIKLVCSSTGAIVLNTEKGDIFMLHEYQCRKLASRQDNLVDLCVIGGKLNHTLDGELSDKNIDLRVVALTGSGSLLVWQSSDPVLRQCTFSLKRSVLVTQISVNSEQVLLVTKSGEAFKGIFKPRQKKVPVQSNGNKTKSEFHKLVEKNDCVGIKLEKIPRIYRALRIGSDPKGQNYGVVQERAYKDFDYNFFEDYHGIFSILDEGFRDLLEAADPDDSLVDVILKVENREFPAHKYILASRSPYFAKIFSENPHKSTINLEKADSEVFGQILKFIYTRSSDITSGNKNNPTLRWFCEKLSAPTLGGKTKGKTLNPVRIFRETADKFELDDLKTLLNETGLEIRLDEEELIFNWKKQLEDVFLKPVRFDRTLFPEFYDVEVRCNEGKVFSAHKSLLVARSEYFSSMFSTRWTTGNGSKISLPFGQDIVQCLLDFLYTDSFEKINETDLDQVCELLKLADLTLTAKLKRQCENCLSKLLTIKNTVPLLTLATMINADDLRENCYRFVLQNLTAFLELRLLDDLDPKLLHQCSVFYKKAEKFDYRQLTPYSTAAPVEEVIKISSERPVSVKKESRKITKGKREETARRISGSHVESPKINLSSSLEMPASFPTPSSSPGTPGERHFVDTFLVHRVKAVTAANNLDLSSDVDNFIPLRKSDGGSLSSSFVDEVQFPLLNSPPRVSVFLGSKNSALKMESKQKTPKMSQKQRKRLSSESGGVGAGNTPVVSESPKNPWKLLPDPVPVMNVDGGGNMESIMQSERKQKENLVRMKNKPLAFTQLEDKAMDELKRFYSVDSVEDEVITIERVTTSVVAAPIWVPK